MTPARCNLGLSSCARRRLPTTSGRNAVNAPATGSASVQELPPLATAAGWDVKDGAGDGEGAAREAAGEGASAEGSAGGAAVEAGADNGSAEGSVTGTRVLSSPV